MGAYWKALIHDFKALEGPGTRYVLYKKFLDGNNYGIEGRMQGKWPSFVDGKQINVPLSDAELAERRR